MSPSRLVLPVVILDDETGVVRLVDRPRRREAASGRHAEKTGGRQRGRTHPHQHRSCGHADECHNGETDLVVKASDDFLSGCRRIGLDRMPFRVGSLGTSCWRDLSSSCCHFCSRLDGEKQRPSQPTAFSVERRVYLWRGAGMLRQCGDAVRRPGIGGIFRPER